MTSTNMFPEWKLFILRENLADLNEENPVCRESMFPAGARGGRAKHPCSEAPSRTSSAPHGASPSGEPCSYTLVFSKPQLTALLILFLLRSNLFRFLSILLLPIHLKKDPWFQRENRYMTDVFSFAFSYKTRCLKIHSSFHLYLSFRVSGKESHSP